MEAFEKAREASFRNPDSFWLSIASHFTWKVRPKKGLKYDFSGPDISWFEDGTLNITENCLDRHLKERGDEPALLWEPNHPSEIGRVLTYNELHRSVCVFAQVLLNQGVEKGDRVCIYLPMVPELVVAMLACARIGAIHSVIFGGFSAKSVSDRINDAACKCVITSDAAYRGDKIIPMKSTIDEALLDCEGVNKVIVLNRTGTKVKWKFGRDVSWTEEVEKVMALGGGVFLATEVNAEHPLFILYTSGSTGKPKGVVHTTGGYMVWAEYTFVNVFQFGVGEVHFCTADIGWVTGHSYVVYGPLLAGGTTLMFEGVPTWPDAGRIWDIVEKYSVNILYTAPTAIRSLMAFGNSFVDNRSMHSLRVLGSVGEPINEEAWRWFYEKVGRGKCPLVDTWWQTETGGIMISALGGISPLEPTYAGFPLPGVFPELLDEDGTPQNERGLLSFKLPWPGMLRTTWGDHQRCKETYFSSFPGAYFTGDGALVNEKGMYRITGRVDDVLNVSGHRIGTAELEDAINGTVGVSESAVVGYPHSIKGEGVYAFVVGNNTQDLVFRVKKRIESEIGAIARPDVVLIVPGLPKTRSGKIMRRILRKIAKGEYNETGDVSTLLNPEVVEEIKLSAQSLVQ
jgi:acetyl-CoA synthetase